MKVELKNLKINKRLSEETTCFSATLYVEGKKVAEVTNRGCGGNNDYHVIDKQLFDKFKEFLKTLPDVETVWSPTPIKMDVDLYVDFLMNKMEVEKLCKKGLVFRLVGDEQGVYRTLTGPISDEGRQWLRNKFGEQLAEIVNDRAIGDHVTSWREDYGS